MARALGWTDDATLNFVFRWTKLKGRKLDTWANPFSGLYTGGQTNTDEVDSFVRVSADIAPSALAPFIEDAVRRLFAQFDGYALPKGTVEYWLEKPLTRTLSN